jgi:hypothetical protein
MSSHANVRLQATFGNAVEMIVSIVALIKGEIRIVQASMLGSILSNILLVMTSTQHDMETCRLTRSRFWEWPSCLEALVIRNRRSMQL